MIRARSECMKKWLYYFVICFSVMSAQHVTAQEMHYDYDEAYDEHVMAVTREQLSDEAFALYEQLQPIMTARQATINFTYHGEWANLKSDFTQALGAVLYEDEYLAYDYLGYSYRSQGYDGQATISGKLSYIQTQAQVAYVEQQVKAIIPTIITPTMDDYAKVKAVHDYVVANVAYDTSLNQAVNAPYFALTGGETLCNGYAMLVYKMLAEVDVPVRLISGVAGRGANVENHAWNLVQVGGKWFHLDATWDDPVPDVAGRIIYNYYLLSDREIQKDHFWQAGGLNKHDAPYPSATTELFMHLALTHRLDVQQALTNGSPMMHTAQALTAYARQQFAAHEPTFTVLYDGVGSPISAIEQALTGNEQGVRYRTMRHRLPNTTQVTVSVEQYKNSPRLPVLTKLAFTPSLPSTVTVGERLPLNLQATYDDGTVKDVTANATWHPTGALWQAGEVSFLTVGEALISATVAGETITQRVMVQPPVIPQPPLFAYPVAGVKALKPVQQVAPTKVWHVNFSNPIKRATNVHVIDRFGKNVPITVQIDRLQLYVIPLLPYKKGETYYLFLQGIEGELSALPEQSLAFTIAS